MAKRLTRRGFLKAGAAAVGAGVVGSTITPDQARLIDAALAATSDGSLSDVRHVVILMQENRSFDHYFGTMPGVRGFLDTSAYGSFAGGPTTVPPDPMSGAPGVLRQSTVDPSTGQPLFTVAGQPYIDPFELLSKPPTVDGQTTNDITHDWGPQHLSWNDGAMDQFAVQHLLNDPDAKLQVGNVRGVPVLEPTNVPIGPLTMGYLRQSDQLAFYRALADAFTICDGYFCSVLGPTDPNRLMWMSGSVGAHSADAGGQVLTTYVQTRPELFGTLDWPTMPEVLTEHGVSWKVYQDPTGNALFNVLDYFKNYIDPLAKGYSGTLVANGLTPVFPAEFAADVVAGTLPKVSWILPPLPNCEHPATPPEYGEWLVAQILQTLLLNKDVWAHTVFLVVYDENGGWFDHVAPPTPGPSVTSLTDLPPGAGAGGQFDGEYLTTASPSNAAGGPPADWGGILGPVGLGFRVPALVISPFSAGGWVCSDTFDHISTLKLIESLFLPPGTIEGDGGLHVSPWRYSAVGDLTSALPNLASPVTPVPQLPATSLLFPDVAEQAVINALAGTVDDGVAYPPPTANAGIPSADPDSITRRPTPT